MAEKRTGVVRKLFGPSREEIWRQLSTDLEARYVSERFGKGDKVEAAHGEWTVTLDTHAVVAGKAVIVFTRMRAPYVNPSGFRFTVYRKGLFSGIGKGWACRTSKWATRPSTRRSSSRARARARSGRC